MGTKREEKLRLHGAIKRYERDVLLGAFAASPHPSSYGQTGEGTIISTVQSSSEEVRVLSGEVTGKRWPATISFIADNSKEIISGAMSSIRTLQLAWLKVCEKRQNDQT